MTFCCCRRAFFLITTHKPKSYAALNLHCLLCMRACGRLRGILITRSPSLELLVRRSSSKPRRKLAGGKGSPGFSQLKKENCIFSPLFLLFSRWEMRFGGQGSPEPPSCPGDSHTSSSCPSATLNSGTCSFFFPSLPRPFDNNQELVDASRKSADGGEKGKRTAEEGSGGAADCLQAGRQQVNKLQSNRRQRDLF